MKLRSDDWHFRLVRWTYGDFFFLRWQGSKFVEKPVNLCPYFWAAVLAIVGAPFTYFIKNCPSWTFPEPPKTVKQAVATGGKYIGCALMIGLGIHYAITIPVLAFRFEILAWYFGLAFAFSPLMLPIMKRLFGKVHFPERKQKYKPPKEKRPNLALEYLKAKKGKYCPRLDIEWADTENWKRINK